MKTKGPYTVIASTSAYEMLSTMDDVETLKAAKTEARFMISDPENMSAGVHKVEVLDADGECVYDVFAQVRS